MKTTILAIATLFITLSGISQSTYASSNNTEESTILTCVNNISEIEIHGNVELYVSGGTADQVKVYNKYYSNNALVQDDNGVLRISSYGTQKLKVWVTASELQKLSVYDNAEVRSFGKLSAIDLDVKLYNNASAQIDMDAFTASITLNDSAKADLTGNVIQGSLQYDQSSFLNTTNLNVMHLDKNLKSHKTGIGYTAEPAII
jgi:phage gp45-like